jgi:L-asparaginase/Glu-tRNA(Gln) amidotransferase subunit D
VVTGLGLSGVPGVMFDDRVFPLSATKGSALSLKAIGCVLADNVGPQKARILMLALTQTRDSEVLQKYFGR